MAMKITAFRHTDCSDGLGSLGAALKKTGENFSYFDSFMDGLEGFDPLGPDLLIVLGGAPGVYQADLYPFLQKEIGIIEKRIAAERPVLGICLGAQLMAAALGARVYPGPKGREKGWFPLHVNEAGMKTPLRHLDASKTVMVHWHGDTFDLPDGAKLLASSDKYENQVFSYGENALALQCHAEADRAILASWIVDLAHEAAAGTADVQALREQTARHIDTLTKQSEAFLREWLAQIKKEKAVA